MKIICIGLPRTGSTSLAKFLSICGLRVVQYDMSGLLRRGWDEVDAIVDFPMQAMAAWILDSTECVAIRTVRDTDSLLESTLRWREHFVLTGSQSEIDTVNTILYGKRIPERCDIEAAQCRIDRMMKPFEDSGRVLRLDLGSKKKAEQVASFIGVDAKSIQYPHENRLK